MSLAALAALAAPAGAATTAEPIHLSRPVQESLERLEDGWLRWTSTFYASDLERSTEAVDDLLAEARQLGFSRLPDLAAGARALAIQAAREGEIERAHRGVEAAERLAPGEPETAFAAARVAALDGRHGERLIAEVRGWTRLVQGGLASRIAVADMFLWLLAAALLAAAGLVVLQALVHGRRLLTDLRHLLPGNLPRPLAAVGLVAILAWPLLLPGGPLWLVLYASVLLWGYGGRSERVTLALAWLLLGLAPLATWTVREHVERGLSPPARALDAVAESSLYGGLFSDLALLPELLPDAPAVAHFLGDVHLRLGQWEVAQGYFEQVIDAEPANAEALIDLGAYHFNRSDFGRAAALFQRAAVADPTSAEAQFDLSKAYVESYLFDESREALEIARSLDDERVSEWMRRSERERIVVAQGGIERRGEIRRALDERTRGDGARGRLQVVAHAAALGAALLALALAAAFTIARGRLGDDPDGPPPEPAFGRWQRALIPGLGSLAAGRGGRAFAALVLPLALLVVPAVDRFAYPVPWRLQPTGLPLILAALAFVLWLGVRLSGLRRGRS